MLGHREKQPGFLGSKKRRFNITNAVVEYSQYVRQLFVVRIQIYFGDLSPGSSNNPEIVIGGVIVYLFLVIHFTIYGR